MKLYPSDDGTASFASLERGEDLLAGLYAAVRALRYEAATLQVIGGLEEAVVGYFDPKTAEYLPTRTGHVEVLSGLGNVSVRDGEPFIHLHLTLSGPDGACLGGHALEGCRTYVIEAHLRDLGGPPPVREQVPGLHLKVWPGV